MTQEEEYNELEDYEKEIVDEYRNEISSDTSIHDILYSYIFTGTPKEFIDDCLDNISADIPDWLWIDYNKTWEYSFNVDYIATSNYIFQNY